MEFRDCSNCGETADAVKAFCPGCGSPFVDEKQRAVNSEFEVSANTVQFSQSAFNMVLSDMGLNIAESSDRTSKPKVTVSVEPAVKPENSSVASVPKKSSALKWILISAAVGGVLLAFLITAAAVGFYFYSKQT